MKKTRNNIFFFTLAIALFCACEEEAPEVKGDNNIINEGAVVLNFNGKTQSGYNLNNSIDLNYTYYGNNCYISPSRSYYFDSNYIDVHVRQYSKNAPQTYVSLSGTINIAENQLEINSMDFSYYEKIDDVTYLHYIGYSSYEDYTVSNFSFTDANLKTNFEVSLDYYDDPATTTPRTMHISGKIDCDLIQKLN